MLLNPFVHDLMSLRVCPSVCYQIGPCLSVWVKTFPQTDFQRTKRRKHSKKICEGLPIYFILLWSSSSNFIYPTMKLLSSGPQAWLSLSLLWSAWVIHSLMYFFSMLRALTTPWGSLGCEARRSRWWAPLGMIKEITDFEIDFRIPPDAQGSRSPLLRISQKKGNDINWLSLL